MNVLEDHGGCSSLPDGYQLPRSFAEDMTAVARRLLDYPAKAQHEALAWAGRYHHLRDRTAFERQAHSDLLAEYELLCQQHGAALQEIRELKQQLRDRARAAVPPAIPPEALELSLEHKFKLRVAAQSVKVASREQLEELTLQATAAWLVHTQMVTWLVKQLCGGGAVNADQGRDKAAGGRVDEWTD